MTLWAKFKTYYPLIKIEWALHQVEFPSKVRTIGNDLIAAIDTELAQENAPKAAKS